MFRQVFLYELRWRLRSKATWFSFLLLALLVYRDGMGGFWDQLMGSGRIPRNSAYGSYYILMFETFWTNVFSIAFFTTPFLRDIISRMAPSVYSTGVTPRQYFWGKYLASLLVMSGVSFGSIFGFASMAWLSRVLPLLPGTYGANPWPQLLHTWLIILIPAVLLHGSVHTLLAVTTGRQAGSYIYCIVHTMLWVVLMTAYPDGIASPLAQTVDPLGKTGLEGQLLYWSAEQRLHSFVHLSGPLLWNRALFLTLSIIALLAAAHVFSFERFLSLMRARMKRKSPRERPTRSVPQAPRAAVLLSVSPSYSARSWAAVAIMQGRREWITTMRTPALRIVLLLGLLLTWVSSSHLASYAPLPNGNVLPVAGDAFTLASNTFFIAILIAVMYFTGEVIGRERTFRVSSLVDASPVPNNTLIAGKMFAVVLLSATLSVVPLAGYLLTQASSGFWHPDLGIVIGRAFFNFFLPMTGFAFIAAALHIMMTSRTAAHALAVLTGVSVAATSEVGVVENKLYLPFLPLENMLTSRFGVHAQQWQHLLWFDLYWALSTLVLAFVCWWFWQRGTQTRLKARPHLGGDHLTAPLATSAAVVIALVMVTAHIHHVTNVDNGYQSHAQELGESAAYEQHYSYLRDLAQPRIVTADVSIDLHTSERSAAYRGALVVRNDSRQPIAELHLEPAEFTEVASITWNGSDLLRLANDEHLRHVVYKLAEPLEPGSTAKLTIAMRVTYTGFANESMAGCITNDGTLFPPELWPRFGYNPDRELPHGGDRKKFGLAARVQSPSSSHASEGQALLGVPDADPFTWTVRVTADAGQVVAAPGQLAGPTVSEPNGRLMYHFTGTQSLPWPLYIASARYTVSRSIWTPATGVPVVLEVYRNPGHEWNVNRYQQAAELALTYLTSTFGAYPYRSLRIVEVPQPLLAHTVNAGNMVLIPEMEGWTHDYRRPVAFDWIQFQMAREIAKAWFGQALAPTDVSGARLIAEGIPSYLGLEVVSQKSGEQSVTDYRLKLMDRYLRESSLEDGVEASLAEWRDQQYLAPKAALMLYAIDRSIGRERLLAALQSYLADCRDGCASGVGSQSLIERLLAATPARTKARTQEDFNQVAVYDLSLFRTGGSESQPRIQLEAHEYGPVGQDNRAELPIHGSVQVEINGTLRTKDEMPLHSGMNDLALTPEEKLIEVDPRMLLLDRNRAKNRISIH